jgi:hypothetical protein
LTPKTAAAINQLLQPVREHFQKDPEAKKILQQVRAWAPKEKKEEPKKDAKQDQKKADQGEKQAEGTKTGEAVPKQE